MVGHTEPKVEAGREESFVLKFLVSAVPKASAFPKKGNAGPPRVFAVSVLRDRTRGRILEDT